MGLPWLVLMDRSAIRPLPVAYCTDPLGLMKLSPGLLPKRKFSLRSYRLTVRTIPVLPERLYIRAAGGAMYVAVMFGLIAGLFAAGISFTLGSKPLND